MNEDNNGQAGSEGDSKADSEVDSEVDSEADSDLELQHAITNMSAQYIHDIATPLANIQLISTMLDTYMPVVLSAYAHLKSQGSQDIGDIPPEHYQTLEHAAAQINDMARQVKIQSKQYWQQIDEQYSLDSGNTDMSRQSRKAPSRSSEVVSVSLSNNLRILVAEDDHLHQKIATKLLNKYHLDIVANGQQAVEAVQKNTYDLLLMDLSMPVMNGQQAAAIINGAITEETSDGLDKLPVMIGLTNKPLSGEEKYQLLEQGFQGILEKPLDMDGLNQLLNRLQQTQE
jgi:CheY-like chemotaxis protein